MVDIDNMLWNIYYKGKLIGEAVSTENRNNVVDDMLSEEEREEAGKKGELEFKLISFGEE